MLFQFSVLITGPVLSHPDSADFTCIAELMSGLGVGTGSLCKHIIGPKVTNVGRETD